MPRPRLLSWRRVVAGMAVMDVLSVSIGLAVAYWLRFRAGWLTGLEPRSPTIPQWSLGLLVALWLIILALAGLYRRQNVVSGFREYERIVTSSAAAILMVIVIVYIRSDPYISRGFLLFALACVPVVVVAGRFVVRRYLYRAGSGGRYLDAVLVVGDGRQAVAVAEQLGQDRTACATVVGFLSDYVPVGDKVHGDLEVLGHPGQLEVLARRLGANRAVIVEAGLAWESMRALTLIMHKHTAVSFSLVVGMFDLNAAPLTANRFGNLLTLDPQVPLTVGPEAIVKRAIDIGLGLLALPVAVPIIVALALVTYSRTGHSGLHRETYRVGERILKLWRHSEPEWANRRHLARLPEFFEVVRGRLSLIGPNPVGESRLKEYGSQVSVLGATKPGFIGPWWLVGRERPAEPAEELAYDLFYVQHYSLWLDFEILVKAAVGLIRPRSIPSLRWPTPRPEQSADRADQGKASAYVSDPH